MWSPLVSNMPFFPLYLLHLRERSTSASQITSCRDSASATKPHSTAPNFQSLSRELELLTQAAKALQLFTYPPAKCFGGVRKISILRTGTRGKDLRAINL